MRSSRVKSSRKRSGSTSSATSRLPSCRRGSSVVRLYRQLEVGSGGWTHIFRHMRIAQLQARARNPPAPGVSERSTERLAGRCGCSALVQKCGGEAGTVGEGVGERIRHVQRHIGLVVSVAFFHPGRVVWGGCALPLGCGRQQAPRKGSLHRHFLEQAVQSINAYAGADTWHCAAQRRAAQCQVLRVGAPAQLPVRG